MNECRAYWENTKGINTRTRNCLSNMGIVDVHDLARYSDVELMRYPNFGKVSLADVKSLLARNGLELAAHIYDPRNYALEAVLAAVDAMDDPQTEQLRDWLMTRRNEARA